MVLNIKISRTKALLRSISSKLGKSFILPINVKIAGIFTLMSRIDIIGTVELSKKNVIIPRL